MANSLSEQYGLDREKTYIGAHVQTETGDYYKYEKNWDLSYWRDLFRRVGEEKKGTILLFGLKDDLPFLMDHVIDLRGKTDLFQMLSIIKNYCRYLIVPDSGILSIAYYVDAEFPLRVVSLWADPRQGVLRQKVPSPNRELVHLPLIGKDEKISNITPKEAYEALFSL
ncbi:MAG: hypothetical protein HYZ47_01715 [Simkania negevensis]|nr:hypothetical protein [Simkania negevensis]